MASDGPERRSMRNEWRHRIASSSRATGPTKFPRAQVPAVLMHRVLRRPDLSLWSGAIQAPYYYESPTGGDDHALLVTWRGARPRGWSPESFARLATANGARAIVLAGEDAAHLVPIFEWAHAVRYPNLEVPRGKDLTLRAFDVAGDAATDLPALVCFAREVRIDDARPKRFVILQLGEDPKHLASLESMAGALFAGDEQGLASALAEAARGASTPAGERRRVHDHALWFETALWDFAGTVRDEHGVETATRGRIEVELSELVWNVDEVLGFGRLRIRGPAPREHGLAASWRAESDAFGALHGHWAVVGESVLGGFVAAGRPDGETALFGSFAARRLAPVHYELSGAVVEGVKLRATWRGELRRARAQGS
jgi:hypothetical protein